MTRAGVGRAAQVTRTNQTLCRWGFYIQRLRVLIFTYFINLLSAMFASFMQTLYNAMIASMLPSRHTLQQVKPLAYNHPLQRVMFDMLNNSPSGTFLHWGVYGSGKSTAAKHAGLQLQSEGRMVIRVHGYSLLEAKSMSTCLRYSIGVPDDAQPLSTYFNRPTTIVVDDFDLILQRESNNNGDTLACVRKLAEESEATKKFNVLIIVTSWEWAVQLQENGCKLIGSPSRWSRDELTELYGKLPESSRAIRSEQQKEELISISALSGTPDFVGATRLCPRRAALLDSEWRKGTKALEEGVQGSTGRFPDKNGNFHWEDLAAMEPPVITQTERRSP